MPRIADVEKAHARALNLAAQRVVRESLAQLDTEQGVLYARKLRELAELARLSEDRPAHAIMEVAGTFKVGQAKATTMLQHGRRSVDLLPRALELLESGALQQGTMELLLWTTNKCSDEVLTEVGHRILGRLLGCDAADARALIKATVLEVEADLDPDAQQRRHDQARANRGVWVKPVEDGMARIGAEVDAISAQRFALGLDELCRLHGTVDGMTGTDRTVEQRRADVLINLPEQHLALIAALRDGRVGELLDDPDQPPLPLPVPIQGESTEDLSGLLLLRRLCRLPARRPDRLMVHIPMTTLLDLDNRSGWVEGIGPISAHQARLLRPTAELQAVWVDADTSVPLGIDPTVVPPVGEPDWDDSAQVALAAETVRQRLRSLVRPTAIDDRAEPGRFPSTTLSELVKVRDVCCTGPGCPMPARRCEQDHLDAVAEGGLTAVWCLALKSARCHHARHDGWCSTRLETGETVWISPLGGEYVRRSPWRPPPPIRKPLPPATLDRPDGGLPRTFGTDAQEPTAQGPQCADEDLPRSAVQQDDTQSSPSPEPAEAQPLQRKTALDHAREIQAERAEKADDPPAQPSWSRPWPTEDPPPF